MILTLHIILLVSCSHALRVNFKESSGGLLEDEGLEDYVAHHRQESESRIDSKKNIPSECVWQGNDPLRSVGWVRKGNSYTNTVVYSPSATWEAHCFNRCKTWWITKIEDEGLADEQSAFEDGSKYISSCRYIGNGQCRSEWQKNFDTDSSNNYIEVTASGSSAVMVLSHDCAKKIYIWLDGDDDDAESGGDPHVINIKGEKFDILQSGTFNILSLIQNDIGTGTPLLHVDVAISRIAADCSESYIQNATLSGTWITKMGYNMIQIRGKSDVLEIGFDDQWQSVTTVSASAFQSTSSDLFFINLPALQVKVDIRNYHNKQKADWQAHTKKLGWNFLNIQFHGLRKLNVDNKIHVGGLLGYDDHSSAAKRPTDCMALNTFSDTANNSTKFLSRLAFT